MKHTIEEMKPLQEIIDQIEPHEIVRVLDLVGYEYSLLIINHPGESQCDGEKAGFIVWALRLMRDQFLKMSKPEFKPY